MLNWLNWNKKEKPVLGLLGSGGGLGYLIPAVDPADLPFSATGGSKSGPTGGYYYHVFTTSSNTTFTITAGKSQVEIALVSAGGGGGGAGPPGGDEGGGGAGGGGFGVFTIGELIPGTYPITIGAKGTGAPSTPTYQPGPAGGATNFNGPPDYPGSVYSGGGGASIWYNGGPPGSGGGGSWPGSPSFTTNNSVAGGSGQSGDGRPGVPNPGPISGGYGGDAGQFGNPGWWSDFLGPGKGGYNPSPTKSGYGQAGLAFGGGGGGGSRGGGGGGNGADGRMVVRYPDSV